MFRFLWSIGLRPMEWAQAAKETGKASPFISDTLDAAFASAQAVVVLLTPDDEARLREEFRRGEDPDYEGRLAGQARPNVLFEAGMAMGHHPGRTVIVEMGRVRPFSDIAGRLTVKMSNDTRARQELAQRLEAAGCSVDLSGGYWHTEGNFDLQSVDYRSPHDANPPAVVEPVPDYDVSDIISLVGGMLDERRKGYERFLLRYDEIDAELRFTDGTAKVHAEKAAERFGYTVEEKGATIISLRKIPPSSSVRLTRA